MTKETRFQQSCPRKLSKYPTKPCPLALQSMEAVRNGQPELAACSYFINNLENNFCFFQYMEEDCPSEGVESTRKIGQQLLMSEKEVTSTLASALEKLKEGGEDINLFAEAVNEKHDYYQEDIYSGEMWITEVTGKDLEELSIESLEPGKPGRKKKVVIQTPKGHSGAGAVHKDGKKIQLHSLSRAWSEHVKEFQKGATPIRIANNNLGKKEKKKDKEDEESKKDS